MDPRTISDVVSSMDSIDKTSFPDDVSRSDALRKAQSLVRRLEKPWESTSRVVWTQNVVMSAIRIAADLDLFSHLHPTPQTHAQLAEKVHCEDVLLLRLLRQLAVGGVVEQEGSGDAWVETEWSRALKDPDGLINGIHFFYDVEIHGLTALPAYLQRTHYRNPVDNTHPPDHDWMHMDIWAYFAKHPNIQSSFYKLLGGLIPAVPWPSYYPLKRVLEGVDASKPLAVDVGGGQGNEMKALVADSPSAARHAIIVQDVPAVVERMQHGLVAPIRALAHDFFQPQPRDMHGARVFFMCHVLHDWPDAECRTILRHIRDAMTPGYSKLLIVENVQPARAVDSGPLGESFDFVMMTHLCGMERTEAQWRAMLGSEGLEFVQFFPSPDGALGVIEVEN